MDTQMKAWRKLWKLNIPNKVKIFCWRLCLNALPSYENLIKRKIEVENWCPMCQEEDGSLIHLFLKCPAAVQVWALSFLGVHIRPFEAIEPCSWTVSVISSCDEEITEKFICCLWSLWKGRNDSMFNGKKVDPMFILNRALSFWYDFKEANKGGTEETDEKWTPPPELYWKINVDAACDKLGNNGCALVVRDSHGNFIYGEARFIPHWDDIWSLEAFAIKMACEWSKRRSLKNIYIESDAQMIIKMLRHEADIRNASRIFVEEARKMVEDEAYNFCWTSRKANQAAHELATYAKLHPGVHVWTDAPPDFLAELIRNEQ